MADLPLLAALLLNKPQYCLPAYAQIVVSVLADRLGVEPFMKKEETPPTVRPARSPMLTKSGVFVLPVVGGLVHRGDALDAMSGAQSYTNLNNTLVKALDDPDVKGILLDIDSPGGQARGCFEFADTIMSARKRKPIWSIANGLAASAAYAVGSSANRFYVTPSGEVGSIGVIWMHADNSRALQKAGIKVSLLFKGDHKADGNPFEPLPDDVRKGIEAELETAYQSFIGMVAARRPMTEKKIRDTEARTYLAKDAVGLGLADEVAPFDAVLKAFTSELNPVYRVSPTGEVQKMTGQSSDGPATGTTKIEGLEKALEAAFQNGEKAANAAAAQREVDAYVRGRADAAAIMSSEAASGRAAQAAVLAGNAKLTVDEATAILSTTPVASSFTDKLKQNDPKVPAGSFSAPDAGAVNDFQADVSRHVHAMINGKK